MMKESKFIVIAYYTGNTLYEDYAKELIQSLKLYDILYHVERIDDLGGWYKNIGHKPTFIKRMLLKFSDLNIVYVDCDARFFKYPKLFDELGLDVNVAAHEFDRRNWGRGDNKTEVLSGTIFLRNNETTLKLVEKWEQECQANPWAFDQKLLENILAGDYYRLPGEYCKIFDTMRSIRNPVIVHYQASRRVRKKKGWLKKIT